MRSGTNQVLIRPLRPADIRACADIAIACWSHKVADSLVNQISEGYYFVADIDGVVVGFVGSRRSYLMHNAWEIPWIAVSPDHQGKRIGFQLMYDLMDELCLDRRAALILTITQRTNFFGNWLDLTRTFNDGWALMTRQLRPVGL